MYMHPHVYTHMITLTGGLSIKTSLLPRSILLQAPSSPQLPNGTRVLYVPVGRGDRGEGPALLRQPSPWL